jgi:hypothetical protein
MALLVFDGVVITFAGSRLHIKNLGHNFGWVSLCHSVTKFKLWVLRFLVDVYALYALYKQAYNDFQDILVRIIAKFKHNKIITSPL